MGEGRQGAKFGVNFVALKKIKYPKGFTLIEILLATAIFTVVAASIYSAFYSGLFGYRNISEAINTYQGARLILERINRDLRNSFAYSGDDSKFNGGENGISFFTLADSYKEGRIVKEYAFVSYSLQENRLLRLCRRNEAALNDDSDMEPEEMPVEVSKLSFSYLEFNDMAKSLGETSQWSDSQNMPAAVKVNLAIKGKEKEVEFGRTIFLP